jgi:hypothetical protein
VARDRPGGRAGAPRLREAPIPRAAQPIPYVPEFGESTVNEPNDL